MTEEEWDELSWRTHGGPVYWQCGSFSCALDKSAVAQITIEWADGQWTPNRRP